MRSVYYSGAADRQGEETKSGQALVVRSPNAVARVGYTYFEHVGSRADLIPQCAIVLRSSKSRDWCCIFSPFPR